MPSPAGPFDAVLVISFGGPEGPADIRPFLANVLRGRRVPPERVEEVAHHYERFGGVSPLTAITRRQVEGMKRQLASQGVELPVYLGMRNWHPLLPDTLRTMAGDGVRRAIGFICAPHRSYSSCTQYRQNVADARAELTAAGGHDVQVTYVGDWHTHEGFVEANARHILVARNTLPAAVQHAARVIFTAHSIPTSMTGVDRYRAQLMESARLVAERVGITDWALVYQSRSGRPQDPWLEPDICDYLRAEHTRGLQAAVLCPIGFLCDHIEVLYDLDYEAAAVARELGLPLARAEAVNDDPLFIGTMAELVLQTWTRYQRGMPLTVAPPTPPERVEGPPPRRG
jgi:ferrochelatase